MHAGTIDIPGRRRRLPWIGSSVMLAVAWGSWSILVWPDFVSASETELGAIVVLAIVMIAFLVTSRIHAYRILGLIPVGSAILLLAFIGNRLFDPGIATVVLLVVGFSLIAGSFWKSIRSPWHSGALVRNTRTREFLFLVAILLMTGYFTVVRMALPEYRTEPSDRIRFWISLAVAMVLCVYAWVRLFRPLFELCVEAIVRRNYRVKSCGPGADGLPLQGPLIVIANHACWWDPLFLAKVLPRPITPMMTSVFFDKWYLKPLMKYVFGTIRVEDARLRREAPEIAEAIRALDHGQCVVLFPEAYLRRKEEIPLRRFGRGVWEILKARPQTPVVACWIEGGWGSYSSHWNGPPTKNKIAERRRSITIGLSAPHVVPPERLAEHLSTRIDLMNDVSNARIHLGLPPLSRFELPTRDEEVVSE